MRKTISPFGITFFSLPYCWHISLILVLWTLEAPTTPLPLTSMSSSSAETRVVLIGDGQPGGQGAAAAAELPIRVSEEARWYIWQPGAHKSHIMSCNDRLCAINTVTVGGGWTGVAAGQMFVRRCQPYHNSSRISERPPHRTAHRAALDNPTRYTPPYTHLLSSISRTISSCNARLLM